MEATRIGKKSTERKTEENGKENNNKGNNEKENCDKWNYAKENHAKRNFEIRCLTPDDPEYPGRLLSIPHMPEKLYVRGNLPREDRPSIAIVGARMCSPYGREQALRYARVLSGAGVQVISGLAYGIDSWGHRGALKGSAPTFAVLGNGVDICYPAENRPLYGEILAGGGGVISEYPPGTRPRNYFFPLRNRIISGLSDVVLIVEAKAKSGSLITAGYGLEQGKPVYGIPGPADASLSLGCHQLIYDGAGIAYSPEILLEEWKISGKMQGDGEKKNGEKNEITLASDLNMVYSCLDLRPRNAEFFVRETGLPPERVSNILVELQLMGLAREAGRHYYMKVH